MYGVDIHVVVHEMHGLVNLMCSHILGHRIINLDVKIFFVESHRHDAITL